MANDFYNKSGAPVTSSKAVSATMRNEFDAVETGFEKISPLSGKANLPVFINSGAAAQEAVSASSARTKLGLAIGTNIQAYDALLQALSALGTAANKLIYTTGVNTVAEASLTPFARTILDDANQAAAQTTLGITKLFARGGTFVNTVDYLSAINTVVWYATVACTVTNIRGYRVGGTGATINARKNGASNHLSSAKSLTSADTWMDGGAVQNTNYSVGNKLEIMIVSVTGNVEQIGVQVDFERT